MTVVEEIKNKIPEILIAVRLPAQDYIEGGLSIGEMAIVTQKLEKLGVDIIDVSSGIGGWRRPKGTRGEGYLINDAQAIKAYTAAPVIGVGGIKTSSFVDSALLQQKVDFTAIGRTILENPLKWYYCQMLKT